MTGHLPGIARLRRILLGEEGVASVEFVAILPILAVLMFGGFEISRLVRDYHVVSNGIRDAGRYLSRVDGIDCPGTAQPGTITAERLLEAQNLAMTGSIATPADATAYQLSYWNQNSQVQVEIYCEDRVALGLAGYYETGAAIPRITVRANAVPYPVMFTGVVFEQVTIPLTIEYVQPHVGQ